MTSESIVRVATPDEYESVWKLMLLSYEENAVFPLDEPKARWHLRRAICPHEILSTDTGLRGVVGVIGGKDRLEGLCFLTIGSFWYSNALHLEEFMVFVHPDHRKSEHAKAFINWMKQQVAETGLPLMTGVFSLKRTEAKCRLYQRMMPKLGEFFFYTPDMVSSSALVASSS